MMESETAAQQLLPAALDMLQTSAENHGFTSGALGSLGLTLAAGILADRISGTRRWPTTEPTFTVFPAEEGADERTVVFMGGGFNSCSKQTVETLVPTITSYATAVYVRGADSGYDPKKDAEAHARMCDELGAHTVGLLGLSMRGMENIPTAAYLRQHRRLPVSLLALGSPMHRDDIRGQAQKSMLEVLAVGDTLGIHGGLISRILVETIGYTLDNNIGAKGLIRSLRHAIHKVRQADTPSNADCTSRARHMLQFDLTQYAEVLCDLPFGYIGPTNPGRDPVVNTIQSVGRINQVRGSEVFYETHPDLGHANPCEHPGPYRQCVGNVFSEGFGMIPADKRRATISLYSSTVKAA